MHEKESTDNSVANGSKCFWPIACVRLDSIKNQKSQIKNYFVAGSSAFLRLSQLYFFWNFSTRPVVSTNFILPVKKGWQAEQISTVIFFFVLRVLNLFPQPQVTVASSYLGCMPSFMGISPLLDGITLF